MSEDVVNGLDTPLPRENVGCDKFIRKAEEFFVVFAEGEGGLVCLLSVTVLTVTVVPAGIFLVSDSVLLADSEVLGALEVGTRFLEKLIVCWPLDAPLVTTLVALPLSFVIGLIEVEIGSLGAMLVTAGDLSWPVFVD